MLSRARRVCANLPAFATAIALSLWVVGVAPAFAQHGGGHGGGHMGGFGGGHMGGSAAAIWEVSVAATWAGWDTATWAGLATAGLATADSDAAASGSGDLGGSVASDWDIRSASATAWGDSGIPITAGYGYGLGGYGLGYGLGYGYGLGGYGLGGYGYGAIPATGTVMVTDIRVTVWGCFPHSGLGLQRRVQLLSGVCRTGGGGRAATTTVPGRRILGIDEEPVVLPDGRKGMKVTNVYPGTGAEKAALAGWRRAHFRERLLDRAAGQPGLDHRQGDARRRSEDGRPNGEGWQGPHDHGDGFVSGDRAFSWIAGVPLEDAALLCVQSMIRNITARTTKLTTARRPLGMNFRVLTA